jgi:hypothetical protein
MFSNSRRSKEKVDLQRTRRSRQDLNKHLGFRTQSIHIANAIRKTRCPQITFGRNKLDRLIGQDLNATLSRRVDDHSKRTQIKVGTTHSTKNCQNLFFRFLMFAYPRTLRVAHVELVVEKVWLGATGATGGTTETRASAKCPSTE